MTQQYIYNETGVKRTIENWLKRNIIPREFRNWVTRVLVGKNGMEKLSELAIRTVLLDDRRIEFLWNKYRDMFLDEYVYVNVNNRRERERIYRDLMKKKLLNPHNTIHALEVYNKDYSRVEEVLKKRGLEVLGSLLAEKGPYMVAEILEIKL